LRSVLGKPFQYSLEFVTFRPAGPSIPAADELQMMQKWPGLTDHIWQDEVQIGRGMA